MGLTVTSLSPSAGTPSANGAGQKPAGGAGGEGLGTLFSLLLSLIDVHNSGGEIPEGGVPTGSSQTAPSQQSDAFAKYSLGTLELELQAASPEVAAAAGNDLAALVDDLLERLGGLGDAIDGTGLDQALTGDGTDDDPLAAIAAAIDKIAAFVQGLSTGHASAPGGPSGNLPGSPAGGAPADPRIAHASKLDLDALAKLSDASAELTALADKLKNIAPDLSERLRTLVEAGDKARLARNVATPAEPKPVSPPDAAALNALKALDTDVSARKAAELGKPVLDTPVADTEPVVKPDQPARPDAVQKPEAPARPAAQAAAASQQVPAKGSEDAPDQPTLLTTQISQRNEMAVQFRPIATAYQASGGQLNVPAVAYEIARQFQNGVNRFQIRLDPPEMGKIDVRMDIDKAGAVHARLSVERAETLDLLQRDSRALERALQQAGMDGARTNLEFSLKQNPFARQDGSGQGDAFPRFDLGDEGADDAGIALPEVMLYRGTSVPGGVNLFV